MHPRRNSLASAGVRFFSAATMDQEACNLVADPTCLSASQCEQMRHAVTTHNLTVELPSVQPCGCA